MSTARFPVQRGLAGFDFSASPVDEVSISTLYDNLLTSEKRNAIFVGETGTEKTHLAVAIGSDAVKHAIALWQCHRWGGRIYYWAMLKQKNQSLF